MRPGRASRRRGGAASLRTCRRGRYPRRPSHRVNACPCGGQLVERPFRDEHRPPLGRAPIDRARFRKDEPESPALANEPGLRADDSHLAPARDVAHRPTLTGQMGFSHCQTSVPLRVAESPTVACYITPRTRGTPSRRSARVPGGPPCSPGALVGLPIGGASPLGSHLCIDALNPTLPFLG